MRIGRPAVGKQFALPLAEPTDHRRAQLHAVHLIRQLHRFQMQLDQLQQLPRTRRRLQQTHPQPAIDERLS